MMLFFRPYSLLFEPPLSMAFLQEQDKHVSAAAEQSLELALDLFHGSANKQDGKKKVTIAN